MKDYPIIKFAAGFIVGIILHLFINVESWFLILLIISFILIYLLSKKYLESSFNFISLIFLYSSYIVTGLLVAQLQSNKFTSEFEKYYKEKNSRLYGEVISVELEKEYEIEFKVLIDSLYLPDSLFTCKELLICKIRTDSLDRKIFYGKINPGNKIYLTGTYQKGREDRNPGEFNYHKYLKSKNISGIFTVYDSDSIKIVNESKNYFKSFLFSIRKSIDSKIKELHNPETAGLLRGLILADRSEISFETKTEFINTGVIHVLAVSGLHVGYILIIVVFAFGRFGIYTRASLTILALLFFMMLTGASPSVTRATIMSIILIIAFVTNRSTNLLNSVSLAAIIILLFNPYELFNPGFQLSFSAVISIAVIYPVFQKSINNLIIKFNWVKKILLFTVVSLSAQIGTLPFTLAYFSKLSVIAVLTNLIVIPAIGFILGIGIITIIIGYFSVFLASYFAAANDLLTFLLTGLISFAGKLEFSFLWIRNYSLYDSLVYYGFLSIVLLALYRSHKILFKLSITLIALASILFYSSFDDSNLLTENKLNILMIDVGQGDSFLLKFPNGKTALIDAGEADPYIDNGERIIMPLLDHLGIDKIDYGFISHLDSDHYGGFISLIYYGRIKEVYRPLPDSSKKSLRLEIFLKDMNVKAYHYDKSILEIGNTKIYIMNNPYSKYYQYLSSNDKSGILKVVYGDNSFLFVGDCEYQGEYYLASDFSQVLKSDVLKVGHHGSKTGSSEAFLNLVLPKYALISAGIKNKFNHPSEKVLESLQKINSEILRTDLSGAVLMQSDGKEIKIINWRNN
ncbi:MAG: DNA internalization-related competence protein ComEC/Rec2 [Ignavibacteriaceae bacterium]|nr:DNA internalization-related competence protein ComEC/Rec2 [Ignavibacteriaceae bacterium]